MSHDNPQDSQTLRETCLVARHEALGARMVPFAGWRMPVQYKGILEEHLHTRAAAGLFDTCHMGEFYLRGPGAAAFADRLVTCRTADLSDGQARYGFLLNPRGGVIDDMILFRISPEEFMIVVNGGTCDKDRAWIESNLPAPGVTFEDASAATAKLDLQGPRSGEVMAALVGEEPVKSLKRFHHRMTQIDGVPVRMSRTGYTGELGYELFFPVESCVRLWDLFLSFEQVRPIGLGARDTLRLEKGLPLYGHELDDDHTPLEAGFDRFVDLDKDFIGREPLLRQKQSGPPRLLTGFLCEGRRAAREGFEARAGGRVVGRVTSGAFSPTLTRGVGLCYLEPGATREGTPLTLASGATEIRAEVKRPPFV